MGVFHNFPELIMPRVSYTAIFIPYKSIKDPELDPAWWTSITRDNKHEKGGQNQGPDLHTLTGWLVRHVAGHGRHH
jgi:hypothetical protein